MHFFEPLHIIGSNLIYFLGEDDFFDRLWDSDDSNLSSHIHPVKTKVKKPKTKGAKAESVEKVTVAELLSQLENTVFAPEQQPYHSLLQIYKKQFLDVSVSKGLIKKNTCDRQKARLNKKIKEMTK